MRCQKKKSAKSVKISGQILLENIPSFGTGHTRRCYFVCLLHLLHLACCLARPPLPSPSLRSRSAQSLASRPTYQVGEFLNCRMSGTSRSGGPDWRRNGWWSSSAAVARWAGSRTSILSRKPCRRGETYSGYKKGFFFFAKIFAKLLRLKNSLSLSPFEGS